MKYHLLTKPTPSPPTTPPTSDHPDTRPPPPSYDASVFKVPTKRPPKRRMTIDADYNILSPPQRWDTMVLPNTNIVRHSILGQPPSTPQKHRRFITSMKKNDDELGMVVGNRMALPASLKFTPLLRTVQEINLLESLKKVRAARSQEAKQEGDHEIIESKLELRRIITFVGSTKRDDDKNDLKKAQKM